jgi:hypothetical protein
LKIEKRKTLSIGKISDDDFDIREDMNVELEKRLIGEFLKAHGYTRESLEKLPENESRHLMNQASVYASGKLAEIEDRAHLAHNIKRTG